MITASGDRPPFRSRPLRAFPFFQPRRRAASLAALALVALLLGRVGFLATARHEAYSAEAAENPVSYRRLPAPRGQIFDADGAPITQNRRCYTIECVLRQKLTNASEFDVDEILSPLEELPQLRELISNEVRTKVRANLEKRTRFKVLSGLSQASVIPILERPEAFPRLSAVPDFRREYPAGTPMGLISGFTGPIPADAEGSYPADRYESDEDVGRAGLEAQFEDVLAGVPGLEERHQDARGRMLSPSVVTKPTIPGADIQTTLRAAWQEKAFQLLGARKGSVMIVELPSGAVRAMASFPSYDPSNPGAPTSEDGTETSQFNRALRGLYPPGSTFKPFVILGAKRGGWSLDSTMTCTGSVRVEGWSRPFHCNVRTGHGPMNATRSLVQSCNAYYFRIAADRGVSEFLAMAGEFGFGAPTGIGLRGEGIGQTSREGRLDAGEELNLSIGQGSMLCTVAQVARAYAGLASGSEVPTLRIIDKIVHADGSVTEPEVTARPLHLDLDPAARRLVQEGMARAISDPLGTAHEAGFDPAWQVCGKTGTAEKAAGAQDAWFAGYYPRNDPRHVVVVHIEESSGHGGEEAAPVAAELIRFMEAPETVPGEIPTESPTVSNP